MRVPVLSSQRPAACPAAHLSAPPRNKINAHKAKANKSHFKNITLNSIAYIVPSAQATEAGIGPNRDERLQLMLTPEELNVLDEFRFKHRMPSRAAAVRELLRRGLAAEGYEHASLGARSSHFGVIEDNNENATE
jgi:hypothetical protein